MPIVYDSSLTLELPRGRSAGTALNALAHRAEDLYSPGAPAEANPRPAPRPAVRELLETMW